jgi:hypothetical protein
MARRMIDAGRYRIDPVTGRMGMSADSAGPSNRLHRPVRREHASARCGASPPARPGRCSRNSSPGHGRHGRGRGRVRRVPRGRPAGGRLPGRRRHAAVRPRRPGKAAEATGVNLDKSGGISLSRGPGQAALDPRVADKLRSFDADRIKRSIKSYVGVVSAMRDIFGDMGKPNAPMQELMAGLEALTMGAMSQIDPGRLGMMVRQTYNLAKQTGVTMDNALMLQQHAAARAQADGARAGVRRPGAQGGLAFGGAYRAQGHGAHTAWGAMSADQVTAARHQPAGPGRRQQRREPAGRRRPAGGPSSAGSRRGRTPAGSRPPSPAGSTSGPTAGRPAASSSRRRPDPGDDGPRGQGRPGAAISAGDVQSLLSQRDTNREFVDRRGLADVVRRAQGTDELHPFVANRMQETLAARLRDRLVSQGVPAAEANRRAAQAARAGPRRHQQDVRAVDRGVCRHRDPEPGGRRVHHGRARKRRHGRGVPRDDQPGAGAVRGGDRRPVLRVRQPGDQGEHVPVDRRAPEHPPADQPGGARRVRPAADERPVHRRGPGRPVPARPRDRAPAGGHRPPERPAPTTPAGPRRSSPRPSAG